MEFSKHNRATISETIFMTSSLQYSIASTVVNVCFRAIKRCRYMKMLMLNVFPRTLLQEKLTLEKKIYSTSLKECFVSKIYSTYRVVNGNPGYSNHCDEQCDVDHGNNQVRPTLKLGKYMSFLRSPQTRAEFAMQSCQPSFLFSFCGIEEGLAKLKREQIAKTINYFKCLIVTFSWVASLIPIFQILVQPYQRSLTCLNRRTYQLVVVIFQTFVLRQSIQAYTTYKHIAFKIPVYSSRLFLLTLGHSSPRLWLFLCIFSSSL